MRSQKNNTNYFERVYAIVKRIPYGKVTTYGAIAKHIGSPQSARMVGWALNQSHYLSEYIPAHRVINRNGILTGKNHFRHENLMQELLESEGITVINNQVQNFRTLFWDPNNPLK